VYSGHRDAELPYTVPWPGRTPGAELAKIKCGLLLEPANPLDGGPFGVRLPLSILTVGIPIRGTLIYGGRITAVQVPAISNLVAQPARSGADRPNPI
jgi:hypothetical protein